jgi:putative flippase GtrA
MTSQLFAATRYLRTHDWRTIFADACSRDAHPLIQFFKYALCGAAAAITHNGILAVLSVTIFPAGKGMIVDGMVLDEAVRNTNLIINNTLAWPFGSLVAYYLNILFVFTAGRHSKLMEFLLFMVVSAVGFFPGILVVNWLAGHLHLSSTLAQLGFILTSVMVNFLSRKFIIFKH